MNAAIAKATAAGAILSFVLITVLGLMVDPYSETAGIGLAILALVAASYLGARLALYWNRT